MALFLEESGTVLDGSGRKREIKPLLPPPKGALASGEIFNGLAQELGSAPLAVELSEEILQPGATKTLKEIISEPFEREKPEATYALISCPSGIHFIEGTLTGRLRWPSMMEPRPVIKMNAEDANRLGLRTGEEAEISSGNAKAILPVELSEQFAPGVFGLSAPYGLTQKLFDCWIDDAGFIRLSAGQVNISPKGE
jgi:hypothetical protein